MTDQAAGSDDGTAGTATGNDDTAGTASATAGDAELPAGAPPLVTELPAGAPPLVAEATPPLVAEATPPLVAEATKGSALLWLRIGDHQPRPAWHVWDEGRALLVHAAPEHAEAAREQVVPGLADAQVVDVVVRGDKQSRVVTWRARVEHLRAGEEGWDAALAALRGARLNETDPGGVEQRWAENCRIAVLRPTGELLEQPGAYDAASHATPPPDSPATTVTRKPYVFAGRRARRRPPL